MFVFVCVYVRERERVACVCERVTSFSSMSVGTIPLLIASDMCRDCVRKTYAEHGIGRFYRGLGLNIVRMAPNTAVQFGSYELLKQWSAGW